MIFIVIFRRFSTCEPGLNRKRPKPTADSRMQTFFIYTFFPQDSPTFCYWQIFQACYSELTVSKRRNSNKDRTPHWLESRVASQTRSTGRGNLLVGGSRKGYANDQSARCLIRLASRRKRTELVGVLPECPGGGRSQASLNNENFESGSQAGIGPRFGHLSGNQFGAESDRPGTGASQSRPGSGSERLNGGWGF